VFPASVSAVASVRLCRSLASILSPAVGVARITLLAGGVGGTVTVLLLAVRAAGAVPPIPLVSLTFLAFALGAAFPLTIPTVVAIALTPSSPVVAVVLLVFLSRPLGTDAIPLFLARLLGRLGLLLTLRLALLVLERALLVAEVDRHGVFGVEVVFVLLGCGVGFVVGFWCMSATSSKIAWVDRRICCDKS
jgi:hypothetical protein